MLYAALDAALRRRLQDVAEDSFVDATITELLAVGISKLQAFIHDINPAAFIGTNTFSTVAGTDQYAKQASSLRVIRVEILKTSGGYLKVPMRNFMELIDESDSGFAEDTLSVADLGTKWLMRPTPDAIRTIRVWYVPIITDSAGWDAVATQIPPALHYCAVDLAVIEALAETAESAAAKEARARINETLALIPSLYGRANEQVQALSMSPFSSSGV